LTGLGLARTLATLLYLRALSFPMGQTPQVVKLSLGLRPGAAHG